MPVEKKFHYCNNLIQCKDDKNLCWEEQKIQCPLGLSLPLFNPPPLSIAYYLFGMMPPWCLARKINKKAPTLVPILLSSAQISVEIWNGELQRANQSKPIASFFLKNYQITKFKQFKQFYSFFDCLIHQTVLLLYIHSS